MVEDNIEVELNKLFEQDFGLPVGTLSQGSITCIPSDANRAVWTARGGVVLCSVQDLVNTIACEITEHQDIEPEQMLSRFNAAMVESGAGSVSLDIGLYCVTPALPSQTMLERVEMIQPKEIWLDDDDLTFEHVFGIREEAMVVSRAMNRVQHFGTMTLHILGVGTHPEYIGRGYGKAVVAALTEHVAREGGVSLWNCDATNTASLRLARSVGFIDHLFVLRWE